MFAYVPQEKHLDPYFPLSVLDVVLMGRYHQLGPGVRPRERDRQVARENLAHVGLKTLTQAPFHALSGGQKQWVLIARALAAEPHALIFLFVSFDYETSLVHGLAARWWNLLLYLTLGLAIAFAIRSWVCYSSLQGIGGFIVLAQIESHLLLLCRDAQPHRGVEHFEKQ